MAEKVIIPIQIKADGNGAEVVTNELQGIEKAVEKVKLKFTEMRENGGRDWAAVTTALASVNQIVGTLNDHIQKVADSFNSFDTSMRAANTMAGLGEEELKRFAFTAKPTHEPLALLAILVACFPETFYNCWCKYQKNQTIYN